MKRSFTGLLGSGLAGLLCAAALSAAEPTPLLDFDFSKASGGIVKDSAKSGLAINVGDSVKDGALELNAKDGFTVVDQAAFKAWAKNVNMRDIAASFWIRFDSTDSPAASLGLFDCFVAKDGTLRLAMYSIPAELLEDKLVIPTKLIVEPGKWYHVEVSYTINSRRYALYVDGKFVAENDKLLLPQIRLGDLKPGGFKGAIRDLKFYDAALDSEELAISDAKAADYDALKVKINEAAAKAKNGNVKAWAADISKRIDAGKANIGKTTIAAFKRMQKDTDKLITLNDGMLAAPKDTVSDQIVTVYDIPATTQDLYLPYNLPTAGKLSNKLDVFLAQDEYESASILVVPFKPVKNFTLKMSDLKNGKNVIKGPDVDMKLVKRWYRTGGAWASYHVDLRMRVLTPDMLLNDDKLIKVDEWKRSNELLMKYPFGTRYENVSDFNFDRQWISHMTAWFQDAPTLQPLELPEAGRNQQYIITFHAAKDTAPGFYTGTLELIADGRTAGRMNVTVRVLPFVLPQPKTYYDLSKDYISHVNHHRGSDASIENGMKHNMMGLNGVANNPRRVEQAMKIGYPMKEIFCDMDTGMPALDLNDPRCTDKIMKRQALMLARKVNRREKMISDMTGIKDFNIWVCASSEAAWYGAISTGPEPRADVLHEYTHVKYFSHGMTRDIPVFSPGIYDMDSNVKKTKAYSDIWHATGGRAITYAAPFPGPENPGLMRRVMGLELYKAVQYDGHMMHGYIAENFNEFSKYPGGDGDYRTFAMCYPHKDGLLNRVAIVGYREGFDDVRYATMLKSQALKYRDVKDQIIAREAKRQLSWLERVDGNYYDMDAFRNECAYRILVLQDLVNARMGKDK